MTATAMFLMLIGGTICPQTVTVGAGATEQVLNGGRVVLGPAGLDVLSGGTLQLSGSSTSTATIQSGVPAGVNVRVLSGGILESTKGRFESILSVSIAAGATLRRIHDTVFTDIAGISPGTSPFLDVSAMVAGDRDRLAFSLNRVSFIDPQTTPTRVNIKAGAATPMLRVLGNVTAHGNRWGETFNTDPSNVIRWHTGQISRATPAGTFDTLEDGLKNSATTSSSVFTVNLGAMAFIDDPVNFNTLPAPGASATGPTILNAHLATFTGKTVSDSDSGTVARGKLVNCVVVRGTVEETTAENCTFFDPRSSVIAVNYLTGTNLLIENGFSGTGNATFLTSVTTATAAYFAAPTTYNLHLVSPGGDAAIDVGTVMTTLTDVDGQTRGADGKPGGTGTWDVGADEFIDTVPPAIASVTSTTANGAYKVGAVINVTVNFSEPVTLVGGNLMVTLNTGAVLTIPPFGPAMSVTASYTVVAGQNSADLNANSPLTLSAGTLRDYSGLNAVLTIPSTQNIANLKAIVIDTTSPTIVNVTSTTGNGSYKAGTAINVTVTFSEPVILAGGNLQVTLSTGTVVSIAPFGPTSTGAATYTVLAGQNSPDLNSSSPVVLVAPGTLRDPAGNDCSLTVGASLAAMKDLIIDNTVPTIVSVSSTTPDGTYGPGASINIRVTFSEPVTLAGGNLRVALNTGTTVSIPPFTSVTTANGTYVVSQDQNTPDLNATSPLTLSAGTLRDLAGNNVTLTIPATQNIANLKAIVIKSTPLPPTNIRVTAYATAVDVEWDASLPSGTPVAGYNVYRRAPGGSWGTPLNRIAPLNGLVANTKFRDTTALINTTYEYQVTAVGP